MSDKSLGFSISARDGASKTFAGLAGAVEAARKAIKQLDGTKAAPKLDADASALQTKLAEAKAKLAQLQAQKSDPTIDADIRAAETKIDLIKSRLEQLRTLKSSPKVDADIAKAEADLVRLGQKLQQLNDKRAGPKIDANISQAQAKIRALELQLAALGSKNVNVAAHVDSSGFEQAAAGAGSLAAQALRALAAVSALGAAAPAVANLAAAFVQAAGAAGVLPSAIVAGATAIGSIKIGLGGISDAYQAVTQAASGGGGAASSSAATQVAAAQRVEDAQRSLAQAYLQADRQAIQSAQAVSDARLALSRAQQQAAWAVADAEERVAQAQAQSARRIAAAEQSLAMAQRSARDAQEALTRAREDATRANRDLQLSVAGAALDEEAATIALARAKERLAKLPADSTALDMQEADLAVRQAQQSLTETGVRYQDLQVDAAKAAKAGVDGSEQVVAAQRQVQDAQQGIVDAEQALRDARTDGAAEVAAAERDLARTRISASQQVADAQTALDRALQAQQWQQADSAAAIADAQRNLARAIADAGQSAGGASGGINAAAAAMAKLSPAARDLVRALVELTPRWEAISKDVQQRQLVGVGDEIRKLAKIYLPILHDALGTVADAENKAFKDVSGLLQTQQATLDVAAGMGNVAKALAIATTAAKPFTQIFLDFFTVGSGELPRLAQGFVNVANHAAAFVAQARESGRLQEWIHGGVDALNNLGMTFVNIGAIIVTVLGTAATAGADVFARLASLTGQVRDFLNSAAGQNGLKTFFAELADTVRAVEPGVKSLGETLWNILQAVGSSDALPRLGAAFSDVAAAVGPTAEVLAHVALTVIPALVGGIGVVSPILAPLAGLFLAVWGAMKLWSGFTALLAPIQAGLASTSTALSNYAATGAAGSATAGRLSTAFSNLGRALPVVGVALIATGVAIDQIQKPSDDLAAALAKGGAAAEEARIKNEMYYRSVQGSPLAWFAKSNDEVTAAFQRQTAAMTPLEQAQQRATQASNDYWLAVQRFGEKSPEAVAAQSRLATATGDVERAQRDAAAATKTHTQAVEEQTQKFNDALSADIAYKQGLQSVKQAQDDATRAAREHGATSDEATSANLRVAASMVDVANQARRKAEAEAQAKGVTDTAAIGTQAYTAQLLSLAAAASGPVREQLLKNSASFDDATLKAISAEAAASGLKTTLLTLPDGRTVTVTADPSQALEALKLIQQTGDSTKVLITIDANPDPATGKILGTIDLGNGSTSRITLDANPDPATGKIHGTVDLGNGQTATITLDGKPDPATGKINATITYGNGQTTTLKLDANQVPGLDKITQVKRTGDGTTTTVKVDGDTRPADGQLRGFYNSWWGKTITWFIKTVTGQAEGGLLQPMAHGGILGFAGGGLASRHLRPMSGDRAAMVPPNTWRVIGDNMTHPELFAPLDGSQRSLSLIGAGAAAFGKALVDARGPSMPLQQSAPPVMVQVNNADTANLAIQLKGLRADMAAGNYGPAQLAALAALPAGIAAALSASANPSAAAATSRVRAELGAW